MTKRHDAAQIAGKMRDAEMNVTVLSAAAVSPDAADGARFPTCAYPATALAGDGTLVCVYRGGAEKHSYDGVLIARRSSDMGDTWSEPAVVFDGTALAPPQSAFSGGICVTAEGALVTSFGAVEATAPDHYVFSDQGRKQKRFVYVAGSTDAGASWSCARLIDTGPHHNQDIGPTANPVPLDSGGLFIPLETRSLRTGLLTTAATFSADGGRTFEPLAGLGIDDVAGKLELCDARFTPLGDGILALLWSFHSDTEEDDEVRRSVSLDNGRTWSGPQPVGFIGQVTAPLVLSDSRVIAASNYRFPPEGIRLWTSLDEGLTWQRPPVQMWDPRENRISARPLDAPGGGHAEDGVWDALPKFSFGTPSLLELHDGSILLTYYATLNDVTHIRACRFRLT